MKTKIVYICLILLISANSCGTRKAELELQKVRTQKLTEMVWQLQNDIRTNVRLTKKSKTVRLQPIDPDKPSNYNGQVFQNTKVILTDKESDSVATMANNSKASGASTSLSEHQEKKKNKTTKSERSDFWKSVGLPIGIALGAAIILFVVFRKRKIYS